MTKCKEIVSFTVKPGTSREQVLAAARRCQGYIQSCEGFITRELYEPTEGQQRWVDSVLWDDLPSAQKAAEGFMASADTAEIVSIIDESSLEMTHHTVHAM